MDPDPSPMFPLPRTLVLGTAIALSGAGLIAGCGSGAKATKRTATPAATSAKGLTVAATEFAFAPTTLHAKAGRVTISLDNGGKIPHELVLLKPGVAADRLKVTKGRVSEATTQGEISETKTGVSASHTFDLKPGTYVYVCNIPGHYADGMRGTLTVR